MHIIIFVLYWFLISNFINIYIYVIYICIIINKNENINKSYIIIKNFFEYKYIVSLNKTDYDYYLWFLISIK